MALCLGIPQPAVASIQWMKAPRALGVAQVIAPRNWLHIRDWKGKVEVGVGFVDGDWLRRLDGGTMSLGLLVGWYLHPKAREDMAMGIMLPMQVGYTQLQ